MRAAFVNFLGKATRVAASLAALTTGVAVYAQPADAPRAAGQLSPAALEMLLQVGAPSDVGITVDGSGAISKLAVEHDAAHTLPAAVLREVRQRAPNAKVMGYETEHYADLGTMFEVLTRDKGGTTEWSFRADGTWLYTATAVSPSKAPEPVRRAALAAVPGGKLAKAKRVEGPLLNEWRVDVQQRGTRHRLRVSAAGEVMAHSRATKATLMLPVAPAGAAGGAAPVVPR